MESVLTLGGMSRRRVLGDIAWYQVAAGALAAITAAWIASQLGVAGTLIGAGLGSIVATVSSAVYGSTLDRGRTLLVQTERGTVIERSTEEGEVADAFAEAAELDSPVRSAKFVNGRPRVRWKSVAVAAVVALVLALAAISIWEVATGNQLGSDRDGTTIGNTFRGGTSGDDPSDSPTDESTTTPPTTTDEPSSPPGQTPSPAQTPSQAPTAPSEAPGTTNPAPTPSPESTDSDQR